MCVSLKNVLVNLAEVSYVHFVITRARQIVHHSYCTLCNETSLVRTPLIRKLHFILLERLYKVTETSQFTNDSLIWKFVISEKNGSVRMVPYFKFCMWKLKRDILVSDLTFFPSDTIILGHGWTNDLSCWSELNPWTFKDLIPRYALMNLGFSAPYSCREFVCVSVNCRPTSRWYGMIELKCYSRRRKNRITY